MRKFICRLRLNEVSRQSRCRPEPPLSASCSCISYCPTRCRPHGAADRPEAAGADFPNNHKYNLTCCPFIGIGTGIEPLVRLHLLREPFRARATCAEEGLEILAGFHFCSFACFPCVCTEKWRCDTCNLLQMRKPNRNTAFSRMERTRRLFLCILLPWTLWPAGI